MREREGEDDGCRGRLDMRGWMSRMEEKEKEVVVVNEKKRKEEWGMDGCI